MPVSPRILSTLLVAVTATSVGCASDSSRPGDTVDELTVSVIRTVPHDREAFTQGLEISDGRLYESTGRNGSSYVEVSDLETGQTLGREDLGANYFGEGFTVADDIAWQITWRDGVAFARDPATLQEIGRVNYDGEGWGLCHSSDSTLLMSDGSATLTVRDPRTFDEIGTREVTVDGDPLENLNELECADDGSVYANVWKTHDIARIDPESGEVTTMIDAEPLWDSMSDEERRGADVLNGIAQIPGTDRFLLTGKLWPTMYEVEFTPHE